MKKVILFFTVLFTIQNLLFSADQKPDLKTIIKRKKFRITHEHRNENKRCDITTKKRKKVATIRYSKDNTKYPCTIDWIKVEKKFQGKKIGSALFAHAMSKLLKKGCNKIHLISYKERLKKWYSSFGFVPYNVPNKDNYDMVYENQKKN